MNKKDKQAQGNKTQKQPRKKQELENRAVFTTESCINDIILATALIATRKITPERAVEVLSGFPPEVQIRIVATCEAVATCG